MTRTGYIPTEIGALVALTYIDLSDTMIEGSSVEIWRDENYKYHQFRREYTNSPYTRRSLVHGTRHRFHSHGDRCTQSAKIPRFIEHQNRRFVRCSLHRNLIKNDSINYELLNQNFVERTLTCPTHRSLVYGTRTGFIPKEASTLVALTYLNLAGTKIEGASSAQTFAENQRWNQLY